MVLCTSLKLRLGTLMDIKEWLEENFEFFNLGTAMDSLDLNITGNGTKEKEARRVLNRYFYACDEAKGFLEEIGCKVD